MRPKLLICIAAFAAAVIGPSLSLAQSTDKDAAPAKPADEHITALSGLNIAVRRTPSVSELDVKAPVCPKIHKATEERPKLVSTYPAPAERPGGADAPAAEHVGGPVQAEVDAAEADHGREQGGDAEHIEADQPARCEVADQGTQRQVDGGAEHGVARREAGVEAGGLLG